ncbi:TPM domain-containing protein [Sphingomonas sp.]|uniref:TPM domain-containing protein n=1 Tax=Sphingomonas sp. TaxID=28214 RepID=UPI003B001655
MLSDTERTRVAAAVAAAEARSDGEIVTVIAPESDGYGDVVAHWSMLLALLGLALAAASPGPWVALLAGVRGGWSVPTLGELLFVLLLLATLLFVAGRLLFGAPAVRRAMIPAGTATRRVRRRAILLFRLSVESRTRARTGVLVYLSLAERRAEIVADAAINERVAPETWGAAMALLVAGVRDGRPAEGMIDAVERIGAVLAEHFPRSPDDTNELPDRLILL